MVVRREKKVRKQRGSRVHGYGRISGGHRASGARGGVGKAGTFKHHNIKSIKYKLRGGKDKMGFVRHKSVVAKPRTTNIENLNQLVSIQAEKFGKKEGKIAVDLSSFGVDKLLGKGKITFPVAITVKLATDIAVDKIEAAGGSVTILSKEE